VAGQREAEQEEVLVSGGGGGWRMQWCEIGRAAGGRAGQHGVDWSGWRRRGREGGRREVGRAGGTRRVERAMRGRSGGARGDAGVRAHGAALGSVGQLDCWVQVMDLWYITLGDE
jgi:hypothetical protein